jgi:hypothetical protein
MGGKKGEGHIRCLRPQRSAKQDVETENSVRRHAANLVLDIGRIGSGRNKHGSANPVSHVREICRIRGLTDRSAAPCYEVKAGGLDFGTHRRIRHHPDMVSIVAQPPPRGQQRAQISQGAPRRQQKMIRHLRSFHHGRELADAIPPARPMRASGRTRDRACVRAGRPED